MASTHPNIVLLKGDPLVQEGVARGPITPGMLISIEGAGDTQLPRKLGITAHDTADGVGPVKIAREMDFVGHSINDVYEDGDTVPYYVAKPGDQYYALLHQGAEVQIGGRLASAGDGTFKPWTTGQALARAVEHVDNDPGTANTPARVKVEII